MDNDSDKLLENVNKVLEEEGIMLKKYKENPLETIEKYALPAIRSLKEIQSALYNDFFVGGKGIKGKIKKKIIGKMANVSRNTVELSLMRQQKFNDNVTMILEYLIDENKRLHDKLNDKDSKMEG
jgi:hypothetical protein